MSEPNPTPLPTKLRCIVTGANGRMGQLIIKQLASMQDVCLTAALEHQNSPALGQDAGILAGIPALGVPVTHDGLAACLNADAILDFSTPDASTQMVGYAAQARLVHVLGTTGFDQHGEAKIKAASRHAVIIRSGNMSLGVNVLAGIVKQVASLLDERFDIEIVEMHHRMKVDAPSGTALLLGAAAAEGRQTTLETAALPPRAGNTGARVKVEASEFSRHDCKIGFASLRGGTVVGDHTVIFAGNGERLELTHRAEDRGIFANGAIYAAKWGFGKKPGLYSMRDVLALEG